MFSNFQIYKGRWGISFGILLAYVLVFFLLYPHLREGTAALAILPVGVFAWLYGAKPGFFAGVLSFAVNTLLLNLTEVRSNPLAVVIQSGGGPGSLAIVFTGYIVGLLRDQRAQLGGELAHRQHIEGELRKSEQRYRTLFESTRRQAQELELLDRVRQTLARELELPLIFQAVVEGIAETFGYTQVSLYLIEGDVLVLQHQVGYDHVIERIPIATGISGQVVRSQQPIFLEDVRNDSTFLGAIEGIVSEVCVPLFNQGKVVGVLNVESTQSIRLSEADLHLMTALGMQVDIAIGRARLYSEVRESEQRFKLMAWATKDIVWDWDLLTDQIWWGEGLQKIFHSKIPTSQTNAEWWFGHIHPEDRDKVRRSINKVVEAGMEFWSKEYRFEREDGTYTNIMDRAYIFKDENGKPYRMIGAMIDITERKQAEETIRHQNEMLSSLHYITLNLLRHRDINQLLGALVEFSTSFLDSSYSEIMLVDGDALVVRASTQNQFPNLGKRLGRQEAPLSWQALDTRAPAVIRDYMNWSQRHTMYDEIFLHAVAVFPIMDNQQCLGTLSVGRNTPNYEFTLDQIQFGRFFANLTALVLNNVQLREALHEQSIRDPLTGLFNRRYMEETLRRELDRVERQKDALGIVMIDLDRFKHYNDTFGHAAGDTLLRQIGQFLQDHIRRADIACRYGGEEFILILPNTSLEAAQERAEYLRQRVKEMNLQGVAPSRYEVTLSIGVAVYPEHGETRETLLEAADAALYRAKQGGRDRVVSAEIE